MKMLLCTTPDYDDNDEDDASDDSDNDKSDGDDDNDEDSASDVKSDDNDAMCNLHAGVPQTLILFGRRLLCTWHGMEASEWSPLTLRCT